MTRKEETADSLAKLVVQITGPWGRWQLKYVIIFLVVDAIIAWQNLMLTFQAPNVDFWCDQMQEFLQSVLF